MNPNLSPSPSTGAPADKFDAHHRQQLSALIDGELPAEQARFMLRRLEHDQALSGCHERWQLLGDVLRGQACAPAPAGFSDAVAQAVAGEPLPAAQAGAERRSERRSGWRRWGGGAALAASVAAVAMFMTRQQLPEQAPLDTPTTVIASQAALPVAPPAPVPATAASVDAAVAMAAVPAAAVAAASRRQDVAAARRASATRTQQAARSAAERSAQPQRALASQVAPLAPALPAAHARQFPFGDVGSLQAKPWPRSTLAPAAGGALNASLSAQEPQAAFYPFEPRLQETDPVLPAPRRQRD
ncbi:sigma-E factor negative regulatory protein [Stenotrophomonas rhizophila]|uniref:sigma-E factor negative regulatory protein n=1 Tax=Stenotrophomonas rhizophila TaxID=216778 RepID=UPI001E32A024|nr:sigma-E factor negative regulatory protein [Stenotrophomonas rhizophila]MCC7632723.1 sigma-E factor negative regulatory protein [Stenotrophomonas rhizophila]MCC7662552.1 sigma-E factor negative regulatory protein [Stenotrophomonas rhizophila]